MLVSKYTITFSRQDLSHFFWMLAGNLVTYPRFLEIGQDSIVHCIKRKWICSTLPFLARHAKWLVMAISADSLIGDGMSIIIKEIFYILINPLWFLISIFMPIMGHVRVGKPFSWLL